MDSPCGGGPAVRRSGRKKRQRRAPAQQNQRAGGDGGAVPRNSPSSEPRLRRTACRKVCPAAWPYRHRSRWVHPAARAQSPGRWSTESLTRDSRAGPAELPRAKSQPKLSSRNR